MKIRTTFSALCILLIQSNVAFAQARYIKVTEPGIQKQIEIQKQKSGNQKYFDLDLDGKADVMIQFASGYPHQFAAYPAILVRPMGKTLVDAYRILSSKFCFRSKGNAAA
jgi:hypothetical protein